MRYCIYLLCLSFFVLCPVQHDTVTAADKVPQAASIQDKPLYWLESLSVEQRRHVKSIVEEKRPHMAAIQTSVRAKLQALQEFSYSDGTDKETLARLGKELQEARAALRHEWLLLTAQLQEVIGDAVSLQQAQGNLRMTKMIFDYYSAENEHGVDMFAGSKEEDVLFLEAIEGTDPLSLEQ